MQLPEGHSHIHHPDHLLQHPIAREVWQWLHDLHMQLPGGHSHIPPWARSPAVSQWDRAGLPTDEALALSVYPLLIPKLFDSNRESQLSVPEIIAEHTRLWKAVAITASQVRRGIWAHPSRSLQATNVSTSHSRQVQAHTENTQTLPLILAYAFVFSAQKTWIGLKAFSESMFSFCLPSDFSTYLPAVSQCLWRM